MPLLRPTACCCHFLPVCLHHRLSSKRSSSSDGKAAGVAKAAPAVLPVSRLAGPKVDVKAIGSVTLDEIDDILLSPDTSPVVAPAPGAKKTCE